MRLNSLAGTATHNFLQAHPGTRAMAHAFREELEFALHTTALLFPSIIEPDPTEIYLTLTSNCNLRCLGCRYGRDFMPGTQLPWDIVKGVLDDCKAINLRNIRFYGGEPLLHPELPRMVEHATR